MSKKSCTLLLDANNLVAMCAHAYPSLTANTGEPIGGLFGLIKRLHSLVSIEMDRPVNAVIAVVDAGRPAFRKEECPEYKSSRKKKRDEDFHAAYVHQMKRLPEIVAPLGVSVAQVKGFEADDVMAALAIGASLGEKWKYGDVVVVSGDKDLLQLTERKIAPVYRPSQHEMVSKIERGYLLSRCIQGDSSDEIKGVPTLGAVRSLAIVRAGKDTDLKRAFRTPKELFRALTENDQEVLPEILRKYYDKLMEHRKVVWRNWRVMNLRRTVKMINGRIDHTTATYRRKAFLKMCKRLGFKSILSEFKTFVRPFEEIANEAKV